VTEDTFRIVVAAAVALACIAFVVQAAAMYAVIPQVYLAGRPI